MVPGTHSRWLMRSGPLEPVLTALLCVGWDVKAFRRFARAQRYGPRGTALEDADTSMAEQRRATSQD